MQATDGKVFVIVLNWNGRDDTIECLQSLRAVQDPEMRIVVVDNGSHDDSVAAIRSAFPEVVLIETGENLGFAGGNNVGIAFALAQGGAFLLLLNNDTIVDPGLLQAFRTAMRHHDDCGVLGGKIYLYRERNRFDHFGGNWNPRLGNFNLVGARELDDGKSWEDVRPIDYACGCVLFIRRAVLERIGAFEPRFFLIWEEVDFCSRARRAGFDVLICPQAKVWHKVSASFVGGSPHATYFWWRNRLLWIERNCPPGERCAVWVRVLLPEILSLYSHKLRKGVQLRLMRYWRPERDYQRREERVARYRAAWQGVRDYFGRRFGQCPDWIYARPRTVKVTVPQSRHEAR